MKEILQLALEGMKNAPSRREMLAWLAIAAISVASSLFLSGCMGSNQLPQMNVEIIPAGTRTAPPPAPPVVVVTTPATGEMTSVPQK